MSTAKIMKEKKDTFKTVLERRQTNYRLYNWEMTRQWVHRVFLLPSLSWIVSWGSSQPKNIKIRPKNKSPKKNPFFSSQTTRKGEARLNRKLLDIISLLQPWERPVSTYTHLHKGCLWSRDFHLSLPTGEVYEYTEGKPELFHQHSAVQKDPPSLDPHPSQQGHKRCLDPYDPALMSAPLLPSAWEDRAFTPFSWGRVHGAWCTIFTVPFEYIIT